MRRILGITGIVMILNTLLFTQIGAEIVSVSESIGQFYTVTINWMFVFHGFQLVRNMITNKTSKKRSFDYVFGTAFVILLASFAVNYPSLMAGGATNLEIPWVLTVVFVPLLGAYDRKFFGFTDERLDENIPTK